jgi:hypothetical protein
MVRHIQTVLVHSRQLVTRTLFIWRRFRGATPFKLEFSRVGPVASAADARVFLDWGLALRLAQRGYIAV